MKTAVVPSSEVFEQGTLNASYYCDREPGEGYEHWQRRKAAEDAIRKAREHERQARKLRAQAAELRESIAP